MRSPRLFPTLGFLLLALGETAAGMGQAPDTLESPRATLDTFLGGQLAAEIDWDKVTSTLAFEPSVSADVRRETAARLKAVLDARGLYVNMNAVPLDADAVDPETGRAEFTPFPLRLPELVLRRGADDAWRVSAGTVRAVDDLYEATFSWTARRLLEVLPPVFDRSFVGLRLWQIVAILVLLFVTWVGFRFARPLLAWGLGRFGARRPAWQGDALIGVAPPAAWFLTVLVVRRLLPDVRLPVLVNQGLNLALDLVLAGLGLWLAYHVVDAVCQRLSVLAGKTETTLDDQLVPLARTVLRVGAVVVAALVLARAYGYPITTLVAGLGLGGLAVALAAQDTLANLLGSFAILGDRPFQVGDWVLVDGHEGTVERVGLRSTRVRTFYDSVVSVPNSKVVNTVVDNMGRRQFRRMKHMLGLRYDTEPERVEAFVEGVRDLVRQNPRMRQDYYEIHLNRFSESSIDVLVYVFFRVENWHEELSERHDFLLDILRLAKRIGVEFAFPTRTLHVDDLPGAPPETVVPAER